MSAYETIRAHKRVATAFDGRSSACRPLSEAFPCSRSEGSGPCPGYKVVVTVLHSSELVQQRQQRQSVRKKKRPRSISTCTQVDGHQRNVRSLEISTTYRRVAVNEPWFVDRGFGHCCMHHAFSGSTPSSTTPHHFDPHRRELAIYRALRGKETIRISDS